MTIRLRLVTPHGGSLSPAFLLSGIIHITIVLIWIVGPMLQGSSGFQMDTIPVELVGGLPGDLEVADVEPSITPEPIAEPVETLPEAAVEADPEPEPEPPPIEEDTTLQEETPLRRLDKPKPEAARPQPAPVHDAAAAERATSPKSTGGSGGTSGYSIASEGLEASELAWYRDRVVAALRSRWRQPLLEGYRDSLTVRVRFEIQRDGTIFGLRIDASSGVPSLDRSALRAVQESSPLPPLPKQILRSTQPATFVFRWDP